MTDISSLFNAYPRLRGLDVGVVNTPMPGDPRKLEFWPPGESGDQQYPRPQGLALDRPGVQIISPDTTPNDIAGDVTSHYLVDKDPVMREMYKRFVGSFSNPKSQARLKQDYDWSRQNEGEQRPFADWLQTTRMPDYLRGKMFGQWPQKSWSEMYTPEQIDMLNQMTTYLKSTPAPRQGPP